ncbi:MAG TPA: DUF4145 domain-containing protein [Xanthobacteraceae bacterium]|nr:DUF4145 domain-containing protein [Xanthobacteraceae bacterium]
MKNKAAGQREGHCPTCGSDRSCNILASHREVGEDEETGVWAETTHYILECGGCKTVFFQEVSLCSEDYEDDGRPIKTVTHYPAPEKRKRPGWFSPFDLDLDLYSLLEETYNSLNADARVLSATGARTVFDRASELLKIDPALPFKAKLDLLQDRGHISPSERANLDVLTDAGGAAAHRGWKPTTRQLDTIMTIVETFVHRKFVLDAEAKRLKAQIPRRQRRKRRRFK